MKIHRLNADATRPGEAIEDQLSGAAEDPCLQPVDCWLHPHTLIAIDPASRLDIDLLTGTKHLLEDVPKAVQPDDTLVLGRGKAIDEETCRAEEHIGDALLARKAVVQRTRRRQELMLAHLNRLAGLQVNREDMSGAITREGDLAWAARLGHEDGHARHQPFEYPLHLMHANHQLRILPQDNVMLEEYR